MTKKMAGILAGLVLFVGTLAALFTFFNPTPIPQEGKFGVVKIDVKRHPDSKLYEELRRWSHSEVTITKKKGQELQELKITIDQNGLRALPRNNGKFHALFAGCSYTFGHGLPDEETLPYLFQNKSPQYQAYNLGFNGGGAHTVLRYEELVDLGKVVTEKKGFMLYLIIPHQIDRFFLSSFYLDFPLESAPVYKIKNDQLIYEGMTKDHLTYKTYRFLEKFNLQKAVFGQKPHFLDPKYYGDFATAIEMIGKRYKEKLPEGKFLVAFHPLDRLPEDMQMILLKELRKREIEVVDLRSFSGKYQGENKKEYLIPYDIHPNGKFNEEFSEELARQLAVSR